MSIWHFTNSLPWKDYQRILAMNEGRAGQLKHQTAAIHSSISDQTMKLIASNNELVSTFRDSYSSMNKSIVWGLTSIDRSLNEIGYTLESIRSDFNYSMGLLLDIVSIQNDILSGILSKLDAIHNTLQSPLLTQARELYTIGCDRLSKGLLSKALEAFIEAEKKNDADFLIETRLGMLYLYGANEDEDVIDINLAKQHLLFAARYLKAELQTDDVFKNKLADLYFHLAILHFIQIGDQKGNDAATIQLLQEVINYCDKSLEYNDSLLEAKYQRAKIYALLHKNDAALKDLQACIEADRKYAIKSDIDQSFSAMKNDLYSLFNFLRDTKEKEAKALLDSISSMQKELNDWHITEDQNLYVDFEECDVRYKSALEYFDSNTFFGYIDCINICVPLLMKYTNLLDVHKKALQSNLEGLIPKYSRNIKSFSSIKYYDEADRLFAVVRNSLNISSYDDYLKTRELALQANENLTKALQNEKDYLNAQAQLTKEINEDYSKEKKRFKLINYSIKYTLIFGIGLGMLGGMIGGSMDCWNSTVLNQSSGDESANILGLAGLLLGILIGILVAFKKAK